MNYNLINIQIKYIYISILISFKLNYAPYKNKINILVSKF